VQNGQAGNLKKAEEDMFKKKEKVNDPGRVGAGRLLAWQSRAISTSVQAVLIGYLMVYCTNALGMSAALVGTLLMASKIVDGFTDLFAGFLVDRTNTKIGRGRPYEVCILGLWLTTWLAFSCPASMTMVVKCVWVVASYIMAQAIFMTFLNASNTVYMVRAFNNDKAYITLNSIGGFVSVFVVIIFNVMFPMFEAKIISSAPGWSRLVGFIAFPLAIIGLLRFFFIKEDKQVEAKSQEAVRFSDVKVLLKSNKYMYIVSLIYFVNSISGSMGVTNYYYLYIVKNVGIMGVMSLFTVIAMFTLLFYPKILKKVSITHFMQFGMLLYIVSGTLNFFAGKNLPILGIASVIAGVAALPISFLSGLLIIDCAEYNEWQGRPRMEGTLGCVTGFANKLGSAFGSFLLGALLSAAGFDGSAQVQSASAIAMIRFLFSFMMTIFGLLVAISLCFYKLEKMKPQMRKDIEERKAQAAAAEAAEPAKS